MLNILKLFSSNKPPVLASNNELTGNVGLEKAIVSVKNTTVYRADTRSPNTIRKLGFAGRASIDPSEVRIFGKDTVFVSGSEKGVNRFINKIDHQGREKIYYVYKIKTDGQRLFSFRENMKKHPEALIEGIAQLATREMGISKEEARVLSNNAIKDDYADVDEIQVEGPIPSSRIEHLYAVKAK